jgi:pilus assembly protein Flp/PilA
MKLVITRTVAFLRQEDGQDLIEYALLAALVALAAVGTMTALGGDISTVFGNISSRLNAAPTGS